MLPTRKQDSAVKISLTNLDFILFFKKNNFQCGFERSIRISVLDGSSELVRQNLQTISRPKFTIDDALADLSGVAR